MRCDRILITREETPNLRLTGAIEAVAYARAPVGRIDEKNDTDSAQERTHTNIAFATGSSISIPDWRPMGPGAFTTADHKGLVASPFRMRDTDINARAVPEARSR